MLVVHFFAPLFTRPSPQDDAIVSGSLASSEHHLARDVGVSHVQKRSGGFESGRVQVGHCYGEGRLLICAQGGDVLDIVQWHVDKYENY